MTIQQFYEKWKEVDDVKQRNMILKSIIDKITYSRNGDNVNINVNFL